MTRSDADGARVDSRWWYWIAVAAVYGVVAAAVAVFAFVAFAVAVIGATPVTAVDPGTALPVGLVAVALLVVPLVLGGLVVSLVFPVALYFDADAVADADVGWEPDPVLYALVGVVGLIAGGFPIQPAVAVYYLYRRHESVDVP